MVDFFELINLFFGWMTIRGWLDDDLMIFKAVSIALKVYLQIAWTEGISVSWLASLIRLAA